MAWETVINVDVQAHNVTSWRCLHFEIITISLTSLKRPAFNFLPIHFGQKSGKTSNLRSSVPKCLIIQATIFAFRLHKDFRFGYWFGSSVWRDFSLSFGKCFALLVVGIIDTVHWTVLQCDNSGFEYSQRSVELIINLQSLKHWLSTMWNPPECAKK